MDAPADLGQSNRGLQRPIGFWLKLLDTLIDSSFDRVLAADRLERRHWQLLNVLHAGQATPAELEARVAPFLSAPAPSVSQVLDELASRAWVQIDEAVRLTDAGVSAHARLAAVVAANRRQLMGDLTPAQYAATVDVLRQMAVNLGWTDGSG